MPARQTQTRAATARESHAVLDFLRFIETQPRQSVDRLLDRILYKSRMISRAEAGTIFIVRKRGKQSWLEPVSIQNDVLRVRRADFIVPVGPGTIAGYVAHTARTVTIGNVYAIPGRRPYRFNPAHEHKSYRTRSMLCFPLRNLRGDVIGVVQLINARARGQERPVPFDRDARNLMVNVSAIIGHFVERANMLEQIRKKNRRLRARNIEIAEHRDRISSLQEETEEAFQLSIRLLSKASEIHDEDTGNHIFRVNEYSAQFARLVGLPEEQCRQIGYSAQLHDVGKMSVDASVLKKKGLLTPEEREEINRHTVYGHQILSGVPRLEMAAQIALNHHERWDGSGYPRGIKGEEIPLVARIVQIADIYDALRSKRSYKPALSHAAALRILSKGDDRIDARNHFDPNLLALFRKHNKEFQSIWSRLQD